MRNATVRNDKILIGIIFPQIVSQGKNKVCPPRLPRLKYIKGGGQGMTPRLRPAGPPKKQAGRPAKKTGRQGKKHECYLRLVR